jgi:hypothetical protein
MAKYKNTSNYRNTPMQKEFLDLYVPPLNISFENTKTITLEQKYHTRPDLLAHDLYGDSDLWWVFVLYNRNKILNPIYDFKSGLTIRVPINSSVIGV